MRVMFYIPVIAKESSERSKATVLSEAENIFVCGYSLPATDAFFHLLFALGSVGNTRLRNFVVFDVADQGLTHLSWHSPCFEHAFSTVTENAGLRKRAYIPFSSKATKRRFLDLSRSSVNILVEQFWS